MSNFKKIIDIKGQSWLQGLSLQIGVALGGIYQTMTSFNPFELMGFFQPALASTELTAPADTTRILTSWNSSNVGKFYALSDTKLYQYLIDSPYTQTDVTAQITATYPKAGAIVWKGSYIYNEHNGNQRVWANSLPVAGGSEVMILAGSSNCNVRPMCIGADGNLYVGTRDYVSQLTSATGTAGNTDKAFLIDPNWTVRDLRNDGGYLVIFADNNNITTTSRVVGEYQCRVYFWDMAKPTADVIWDISDSYLISGAFLDGKVYVFGYNGIYVCNSVTSPKFIFDFRGNSTITRRPLNPYDVVVGSQDIYWGDTGSTGFSVHALRGTTFYSPYLTFNSGGGHVALMKAGDQLVAATDEPKIYINNAGTTRASATIQTNPEPLDQPYSFGYAKVTLKSPLSSGQAVQFAAYNSNGSIIVNPTTKSYSASQPLKYLIFGPSPTSASVKQFEDIYISVTPQGGAVIERVTVYGTPSDDYSQS